MSAENNGRQMNQRGDDKHGDSQQNVEITSLAMGQLNAEQSRQVEQRVAKEAASKQVFEETQRLAAATLVRGPIRDRSSLSSVAKKLSAMALS